MKNVLLSLGLLVSLSAASHAQFKITTFDGKTVANKNKPDTAVKAIGSEFYFVWETDFVRVQWNTSMGDKPAVSEALLYYVDFATLPKPEKLDGPSGLSAYGLNFNSKKGETIPTYVWREAMYSQQMSSEESLMFATQAEMKSFTDKFTQRRKSAKPPVKRIVLKTMLKEKK